MITKVTKVPGRPPSVCTLRTQSGNLSKLRIIGTLRSDGFWNNRVAHPGGDGVRHNTTNVFSAVVSSVK